MAVKEANIEKIYETLKSRHKNIKRKTLGGNGQHLLINGNSVDVLKDIPDGSIDLIFTDPPYNAKINYGETGPVPEFQTQNL